MVTSRQNTWWVLAGFFAITFAASAIGGLATQSSVGTWYQSLNRPSFNPPDWIFAPVWTTLYAMIAVAGWRLWRAEDSAQKSRAIRFWYLQLALNVIWSLLFFGAQDIPAATVEIGLLLASIVMCLVTFRHVDRWAFWLFVPYTGWVAFATLLTISLLILNPSA